MASAVLVVVGFAVALLVGLGRQFTVFTAFEPGLWFFRRYPQKRNAGFLVSIVCVGTALLFGVQTRFIPLIVATAALLLLAFLFRLELLFPALDFIVAVPSGKAELADIETVMLVTVPEHGNGDGVHSRAYPLDRMVIARHLVHDTLGRTPVVITYCALCRTGLAFRAEFEGHPIRFRVVGVFRRNLIMEDVVTGTLWQQATGLAIYGPLAGNQLELLQAEQITWRAAKRDLDTGLTLAVEPPEAERAPFASNRGFSLLQRVTDHVTVKGHTRLSRALPRREIVYGIVIHGQARAYPREQCRNAGRFQDTLGGAGLDFEYDHDSDTLRVHRIDGGPPPIVEQHWWLGWNEFHPDSTVWRP